MIDPLTRELADVFVAAGYHAVALDPVPPSNTGFVEISDSATGSTAKTRLFLSRASGLWFSIDLSSGDEIIAGFFPQYEFDKVLFHVSMMYPETAP